jgi:hypothetical protein
VIDRRTLQRLFKSGEAEDADVDADEPAEE